MTACASPIGHERLVAYWADDLDPAERDAVEDHLFGCEPCAVEAEGVARIAHAFRVAVPPVISQAEVERLRAAGLVVVENAFAPGSRSEVTFERGIDLLIHRLVGLDLARADRVDVTIRSESGVVMFEDRFVPFDRERGEVLIACQRHFAAFPPDVVFDVRVHAPAAAERTTTYVIPHVYVA